MPTDGVEKEWPVQEGKFNFGIFKKFIVDITPLPIVQIPSPSNNIPAPCSGPGKWRI
jgi:hypothetical protein